MLSDLFPLADLDHQLKAGYVRRQTHPDDPQLHILNYTEKAAFAGAWDDVTTACRGLIVRAAGDGDYFIVANPWSKFFNYEQDGAAQISLDEPVEVTDKMDGSLGILYPAPDGQWAIATRGSFTSEQALHATALLRDRYEPTWIPLPGITYLFEIVYPANRVVLDYGATDDLVLLGGVMEHNRAAVGPTLLVDVSDANGWPGPVTKVFQAESLADALCMPPRPNAEGIVVRAGDRLVKIKQADYVALHRILTNTSSRRIWEHLVVHGCSKIITNRLHWGSHLGLDPARADECLAAGDAWLDRMLAGVPDEFYAWVHQTIAQIDNDVLMERIRVQALIHELSGLPRRDTFTQLVEEPAQKVVMGILFGNEEQGQQGLTLWAWRQARPPGNDVPFAQSEAAA